MRRNLIGAALLAGLVLALAACGGSKSSAPPATTTVVTTVAAPPTTTAPTTTAPVAAPCGAGAFLPVLKDAMDGAAPKLTIVRAEVRRCRNDYAQVFAVPDPSVCKPGVEYCYETEQVFLRWDGGAWKIETSGTGSRAARRPIPRSSRSAARSGTRISPRPRSRCRRRTSAAPTTPGPCAATS